MHPLLANLLAPENMIWIAVVALLLFGRRLPEVGRSLGKGIVEFKKGLQGIEEDINTASTTPTQPPAARPAPRIEQQAPVEAQNDFRFDPYTGKPIEAKPAMRFDPYTGKPLTEEAASQSSSNA